MAISFSLGKDTSFLFVCIGTPNETPIVSNACDDLIKLKLHHPLDFQARFVSDDGDIGRFSLWARSMQTRRWVNWRQNGDLYVTRADLIRVGVPNFRAIHGSIAECRLNSTHTQWSLKGIRDGDKTYPNSLETVEKTMETIKQGLKLTDIFPKELFETFNRPEAYKVLEIRDAKTTSWSERCTESEAIKLPEPMSYGPVHISELRQEYKKLSSPFSLEGLIYSLQKQ